MTKLNVADLFCGGGGTSHGAERSGAATLRFALNHWQTAIKTHTANFPDAQHVNARLADVRPTECRYKLHLLFASPECTHHSNARGGRPMEDQRRAGANDVLPWLHAHRPEWFVVENVREFMSWGPLDPKTGRPLKDFKGSFFEQWIKDCEGLGYTVEFQLVNAADCGAHTSRTRLFVIGRKRGRKKKAIINWPTLTHHKTGAGGLPVWRPAYEIIDWSLPCPSIFTRKRPLKPKTIRRISVGLRKFCAPFLAQWDQQSGGNHVRGVDHPMYSMTTKANTGVAIPYGINMKGQSDAHGLGVPSPTQTAHAAHLGLAMPYLASLHHHNKGSGIDEPVPTVLAGGTHHAVVQPFIANMTHGNIGSSPDAPMPTIVTTPHHAVVTPFQYQLIGRGAGRSRDTSEPVPTIIAARENHGIVVPYRVEVNHGDGRGGLGHKIDTAGRRVHALGETCGSVTTKNGEGLVVPVLTQYYGTGHADGVDEPLATITSKERHALTTFIYGGGYVPHWSDVDAAIDAETAALLSAMIDMGICDIGFRMLNNLELALAQGFDPDYQFCGTKSDITCQIGNSVSPCAAQAITLALAG